MKFAFTIKLIGFYLLLCCCESKEKVTDIFPVKSEQTQGWIVYEGFVPVNEKASLFIELSLLPGAAGEGEYHLTELLEVEGLKEELPPMYGRYSTLVGSTVEEVILYVHKSSREKGIKRTYLTLDGKRFREELIRTTDLTLRKNGDELLIVLNSHAEPLTLESKFNLKKRSSKLFTVEGYFAHTGDSAVFLEMNTKERWGISKRGQYDQALQGYYELTEKKFESVYVKAIGYSIVEEKKNGRKVDALVLKKILQMSSAPE